MAKGYGKSTQTGTTNRITTRKPAIKKPQSISRTKGKKKKSMSY